MKIKSVQSINLCESVIQTILKEHGGELKVETKENEESTFIIQTPLPI